jgi:hypothetical protein
MKVYILTHSSGTRYEGGSDEVLGVYTDIEMAKLLGIEYAKLWLAYNKLSLSKLEFTDGYNNTHGCYLDLREAAVTSDYDTIDIYQIVVDDDSFLEEYKERYKR